MSRVIGDDRRFSAQRLANCWKLALVSSMATVNSSSPLEAGNVRTEFSRISLYSNPRFINAGSEVAAMCPSNRSVQIFSADFLRPFWVSRMNSTNFGAISFQSVTFSGEHSQMILHLHIAIIKSASFQIQNRLFQVKQGIVVIRDPIGCSIASLCEISDAASKFPDMRSKAAWERYWNTSSCLSLACGITRHACW